ncbi:MAG TPA: hypothetical protein VNI81_03350 [Candidatus Limnocylindrales bacterium]|nr:hypothetical protein [Candidatus Limnocylindrales bacterium]
MRPYRDIATLAGVQVLCFLLLSHLEPDFFLIHFYQTTIYLALLILLFYMEDRWAYMIGMLAPAAWLVMAFATGLLGGAIRQMFRVSEGAGMANLISLVAGVTAILSLLMIGACGRHWFREYAGLGKSLSTFAVSFGIVAVYYAILVVWFWRLIPVSAAGR